jgi:hypothetical protein
MLGASLKWLPAASCLLAIAHACFFLLLTPGSSLLSIKPETLTVRPVACYSAFSFFTNEFSSMFCGITDHAHGKQRIFHWD